MKELRCMKCHRSAAGCECETFHMKPEDVGRLCRVSRVLGDLLWFCHGLGAIAVITVVGCGVFALFGLHYRPHASSLEHVVSDTKVALVIQLVAMIVALICAIFEFVDSTNK